MKWPQRYRQACSHSPRPFEIIGLWPLTERGPSELRQAERKAHSLFPRVETCDGREWFSGDARTVVEQMTRLLGREPVMPAEQTIEPYDDWRDWARPRTSQCQRRLWVGSEATTGRIKIVHSPHVDLFFDLCPTYNCDGFRWIGTWVVGGLAWEPSTTLNEADHRIVLAWETMVERHGFGIHDPRVGWLAEGVDASFVSRELGSLGLIEIDPRTLSARGNTGRFVASAADVG